MGFVIPQIFSALSIEDALLRCDARELKSKKRLLAGQRAGRDQLYQGGWIADQPCRKTARPQDRGMAEGWRDQGTEREVADEDGQESGSMRG